MASGPPLSISVRASSAYTSTQISLSLRATSTTRQDNLISTLDQDSPEPSATALKSVLLLDYTETIEDL
jgi:hypothetical protein